MGIILKFDEKEKPKYSHSENKVTQRVDAMKLAEIVVSVERKCFISRVGQRWDQHHFFIHLIY